METIALGGQASFEPVGALPSQCGVDFILPKATERRWKCEQERRRADEPFRGAERLGRVRTDRAAARDRRRVMET